MSLQTAVTPFRDPLRQHQGDDNETGGYQRAERSNLRPQRRELVVEALPFSRDLAADLLDGALDMARRSRPCALPPRSLLRLGKGGLLREANGQETRDCGEKQDQSSHDEER